ncbi:MAG: hypothetical protein R2706_06535 [Acidimicrobiales bacterium]
MSQTTRWVLGAGALAFVLSGCGADGTVTTVGAPTTTIESTSGPGLVGEPTPLVSQLTAAPDSLSSDELVAIARDAQLTVSWGCGLGFTLASADQHVALYLYPASNEATASPVSFPDPTWSGVLVVGNDLLSNHCDDVMEDDEPVPYQIAEWALGAGTLTFDAPADAITRPQSVTGELVGGVVDTPAGPFELEALTIVNDAFGLFAG